jgi:hypothetical protein
LLYWAETENIKEKTTAKLKEKRISIATIETNSQRLSPSPPPLFSLQTTFKAIEGEERVVLIQQKQESVVFWAEPEFLRAQESIPRNEFHQPMYYVAWRAGPIRLFLLGS